MNYIYANLKRFDVQSKFGGLNSMCDPKDWANYMVTNTQDALEKHAGNLETVIFFPEAHIIPAVSARKENAVLNIGCQGVFRGDVEQGKNFGAFTTNRPAKSMTGLGCNYTMIGHCEERADKLELISLGGNADTTALNEVLNKEVLAAISNDMTVLYCVGEKLEEQDNWEEVISAQLKIGLKDADLSKVRIAYEPVWSIGPGRPVPDKDYIQKVAKLSKSLFPTVPIIYGGGLKHANADMLASIPELDGGLVGLTKFTDDIGFYPAEFAEIIDIFLTAKKG